MNLQRKPLTMFVALLTFGLSPDSAWSNAGAKSAGDISQAKIAFANELYEPSIIGEALAISDTMLNEMRGGFTTTSGLQVTFGIERALYVNGELISTTSLNVVNLGNVNVTPVVPVAADLTPNLPNVAELSSPTITLPPLNAGAPGTSTSMPGSVATSSPATAVSTPSASGNASPSTLISSVTSTPGSVALIQSGAGNTIHSGTFSTSSLGTVVQNTLNNQKIQNVAVISATVNSMEILKALNLQSAISSAINDAVRK